jgi:hypothetical protein
MKVVHTLAVLALLAASTAFGRETGIINQAGPYEQTLKFFLHPAHLYLSGQAPRLGEHPAVQVKARASREVALDAAPAVRIHPALVVRRAQQPVVATAH